MSVIGEMDYVVTATSAGFVSGLKTAEDQLMSFVRGIESGNLSLKGFAAASTIAGIAIAGTAIAIGSSAIKAATDFNNLMITTGNNAGMTAAQIREMSQTILDLSASTGAAKEQLAQGYMYIHDMGYGGADAMNILTAATKEALATGADISTVASTLATVMHEFGVNTAEALPTLDILHTAATASRMTLQDMVSSFGPVGSIAAQIGVPLDQTAAAFGALTRNGYDASRAATQVQDILVHLLSPTAAAKKEIAALSKATGIDLVSDFSEAGLKAKGLVGVLNDIKEATGGSSSEVMKLIPALRGGLGAAALVGKANPDMTSILGQEQKSKGSTESAYDIYTKSATANNKKFQESLNNLNITLGNTLVPLLNKVVVAIIPIIQQVANWIDHHKKLTAAILVGIGIFGILLTIVGVIAGAIALIGAPILGVIALVALLATAYATNFLGIRNIVNGAVSFITQHFRQILLFLGPGGWLVLGIINVATNWKTILSDLKNTVSDATGFINDKFKDVSNFVGSVGQDVHKALSFIDPKAHHSPSLVEQVSTGVALIKDQYASLSSIQLPNLAGSQGASNQAVNYNYNSSSPVTMNNSFNVTGEANASNIAQYMYFQLQHKGLT